MTTEYTINPIDLAALLLLPTQATAQGDELKLEIADARDDTAYRVWVSGMTDADREELLGYTGVVIAPVEVERYDGQAWIAGAQSDLDRALRLAYETGNYGPIS